MLPLERSSHLPARIRKISHITSPSINHATEAEKPPSYGRPPHHPTSFTLANTSPENRHPRTRAARRRVVLHVGPTNSGKTHDALQTLERAHSDVHCATLRWLMRRRCWRCVG
ncbi:MAG: hypothetical protein ACLRNL_06140 [Bifidobacterium adolescentis]